MNKKLTLISLFLCLFLWPLGRVFANVERVRIPSVFGGVLNIEFLTDSLIHFELTGSTADASMVANMIPVTPMVKPQVYLGPSLFVRNENSFETASLKIEVDSSTLCLSPVDKKTGVKLTMICPRWRSENPAGLTIDRGVTQNTYGLAEEFLNPGGDNGDWINRVRSSPNPYGNVLEPFAGGAVENAQFPVLYLVGKNDEDYALFLDNSLKQTWNLGRTPWRVDAPGGKTLRWFLIGGSNLPSLRTQFMGLVGHPMVPPKKAFGLWVSQFGFRNWAEMEGKLKTLRLNIHLRGQASEI